MTIFEASQIKGQVHFGIITIRQDEFEAVLQRFPSENQAQSINRLYSLSQFKAGGKVFTAAVVRCPEQGTGEAQNVARDLIEDLSPGWIVVVGIAGGVPNNDFSLGDVIVGTQIIDFSREAIKQGELSELDLSGGIAHQSVRSIVAQIPALKVELGNWNGENAVTLKRPNVELSPERFYGSVAWKKKTRKSLEKHFSTERQPVVFCGPIASSDRLVKSTTLPNLLLKVTRSICCVEMEAAGVYRAAQRADRQVPVLVIRGLSDIIGFDRDGAWTLYACHAAASFASALLRYVAPSVMLTELPQPPVEPLKKSTSLLRLTQRTTHHPNKHSVEVVLEGSGPRKRTVVDFEFELPREDWNDFRWYLEDYLQYPLEPNPKIASRIEKRMKIVGQELFTKIFGPHGSEQNPILDAKKIWEKVSGRLSDTRFEIVTDVNGATTIPWELMCTKDGDKMVALAVREFVRAHPDALESLVVPETDSDQIRVLLVICRPNEKRDVPFRSVAGRILKGLEGKTHKNFQLDVLRPPSYKRLVEVLEIAQKEGRPYHVVHFDGHGAYFDVSEMFERWKDDEKAMSEFLAEWLNISTNRFSPDIIYPRQVRDGNRGYLIFENPESEYNLRLVDGQEMGELLQKAGVPVLVLNACRSAHADFMAKAEKEDKGQSVHSQVRSFGSFAQEVSDKGVAGVVAMRYNVYVATAAEFIADLYSSLVSGLTLGEAVSHGRQYLNANPCRSIGFDDIELQDWSVPVVYEAAPIQLFSKPETQAIKLDLSKPTKTKDNLPRPDVGFFGRDETILALDRAFDTQPIVLLHAYAGSGKTMTAAEFARWYAQTGGLELESGTAPILFTSFEQYKPLAQVLSAVEETYRPILEANNIQWLALNDEDRLNIALQIFQQIPPLWIWDNVEPIHGFPAGTTSAWSEKEQRELKMFLQIVTGQSKTKFLLTSRRDEREWLGDLPMCVTLPPMPMQERVRLTSALADKQGKRIAGVKDWLPLLRFTQGNPLTITVMVGQALRDGISSKEQIEDYLNKLHNGEQAFDDEANEGRSKSLGASLSYGFEQAFSEDERKVLALLHFFQGFVDVDVLKLMVANEDCGVGSKDFTREKGIAILDKAADIGLLTSHGGGYYTIHPALPWFFHSLFEQYYPSNDDRPQSMDDGSIVHYPSSIVAARAFVKSMGELGDYYHGQHGAGDRDVIASLRAEEPNLLQARSLALQHGWWYALIGAMQGLDVLYSHMGRRAEWKRLVEEIVPEFVGADDLPLSGREKLWSIVTQYRVRLAENSHDWAKAERLQGMRVDWHRSHATSLLARPAESLLDEERNTIRSLAVSIRGLGDILREQGKPECAKVYEESIPIYRHCDDKMGIAIAAFNLGHAYKNLPAIRNLNEAERWYQEALRLFKEVASKNIAQTLGELGVVAYERFKDAKKEGRTEEELLKYLNAAADYCRQALTLLPPDAVNDLAMTYRNLGNIYMQTGDVENSLKNSNQSIRYSEIEGNLYQAGETRVNVAITLAQNKRFSDALLYTAAALRNFESYKGRAKDMEDQTKGLIAEIEEAMKK